jgi:uncharacterized protein
MYRVALLLKCILASAGLLLAGIPLATGALAQTKPALNEKPTLYEEQKRLANASIVTIMSSSTSSTYTRFVEDIQNVLDDLGPDGLRILPILGRGGGQNFRDMMFLRNVDMGTTDADYMRYFKETEPWVFAQAEQRVHYIVKLFNAEFHVLARRDINSYADLQGKRVNFFKPLSNTALAAETIFRILGIGVVPTNLDNDQAIEKLRNGELAAVVRLSGAPHTDYAGVKPQDGFRLLPLDERTVSRQRLTQLYNTYLPTELTHAQYPDLIPQGTTVPTVAGSVVLATFAWPEGSERYQKTAKLVRLLFDNFDKFIDPSRHPKWREVSLTATVPGWVRFKPAQEWLDAHKTAATQPPTEIRAAFERFLKDQESKGRRISVPEREALFRAFDAWWNNRQTGASRN